MNLKNLPSDAVPIRADCPVCTQPLAWVLFPDDPGSPLYGPHSCTACGKPLDRSWVLSQADTSTIDQIP